MTSWTEMSPIEFDAKLAPTKRARQFVETAPETLFPRLLPEAKPRSTAAPDSTGTAAMFETEEL